MSYCGIKLIFYDSEINPLGALSACFWYRLLRPLCNIPTFVVTLFLEVREMKFVGVREFKQDVVKYLNEGNEIVVMKRKKPIARLTPVQKNSAEIILLEIGRVLNEAEVSKKEALKALDRARREIYG